MTNKKSQKTPSKTKQTGVVRVGVDGDMLRLQFPSEVSQKIWHIKQKYKALGLSNTPKNMAKAQEIAAIASGDILDDRLDISLEKYNAFTLQETLGKIQPDFPKLQEFCQRYYEEVKKPVLEPGTKKNYELHLMAMKKCSNADIIKDAIDIRNSILKVRSPEKTRLILRFIYNAVEWGKRNELIPKSVENPYKDVAVDVVGKEKYQKPQHIREIMGEEEDSDCRAFNRDEAREIIAVFANCGKPEGVYKDLVEFLFLSGCRTGEAVGLRWEDITDDCDVINFRHSYCIVLKDVKALKPARHGKTSRKFPCGERLKQLLLKLRDSQAEILHPKSFVFHREGKPIKHSSFYKVWAGCQSRQGAIEILMKQGKVQTYLKPYATRHSFITWQLKAGMAPANVAKLVGNSPETIYKYYVSADEDARVAFEV